MVLVKRERRCVVVMDAWVADLKLSDRLPPVGRCGPITDPSDSMSSVGSMCRHAGVLPGDGTGLTAVKDLPLQFVQESIIDKQRTGVHAGHDHFTIKIDTHWIIVYDNHD